MLLLTKSCSFGSRPGFLAVPICTSVSSSCSGYSSRLSIVAAEACAWPMTKPYKDCKQQGQGVIMSDDCSLADNAHLRQVWHCKHNGMAVVGDKLEPATAVPPVAAREGGCLHKLQ